MTRAFFDTNILVYAYSADPRRDRADLLIEAGGVISVQSLNELANVLRRKQKRPWPEVRVALQAVRERAIGFVKLDEDVHRVGIDIAERYRLSIYDAMIVAAALTAGCDILYSEDMHDGLVVDGRLRIANPFAAGDLVT